jgi:hypothetical protein
MKLNIRPFDGERPSGDRFRVAQAIAEAAAYGVIRFTKPSPSD